MSFRVAFRPEESAFLVNLHLGFGESRFLTAEAVRNDKVEKLFLAGPLLLCPAFFNDLF
jgi:hypothetical protein